MAAFEERQKRDESNFKKLQIWPEMAQILRDINMQPRWSCDITTGLLGQERDGPWVMIDHKKLKAILSRAEKAEPKP